MNSAGIVARVTDLNRADRFPDMMKIVCAAVPRVGDSIDLFEVIPQADSSQGWTYEVFRVTWSLEDGEKVFSPVLTVRQPSRQ